MPDPRQTVERMRAILQDRGDDTSINSVAVAADYADFCRSANFRLRRCADLLRDGLIGEAVEHASSPPDLLEMVGVLQCSEAVTWDHKCENSAFPRAQRLAIEGVPSLQHAIAAHVPLRDLLAKYRYLSLARAPLRDRLIVVRQLIAAAPTTAAYKRDAEDLERARLADIRNEASVAFAAADGSRIDALVAEVNSGPWQIPVPDDMKTALAQSALAVRQSTATEQLRRLVPEIRAALNHQSLEHAQQVFARWGKVVRSAKITVPPDLREEISPLGQWLDEQEDLRQRQRDYRFACDALAAAIESGAPLELLTRRYRDVSAFAAPVPEDLSSQYRRALQSAERQHRRERRKQFALAAILIIAIGLAMAALGYVIFGNGKVG